MCENIYFLKITSSSNFYSFTQTFEPPSKASFFLYSITSSAARRFLSSASYVAYSFVQLQRSHKMHFMHLQNITSKKHSVMISTTGMKQMFTIRPKTKPMIPPINQPRMPHPALPNAFPKLMAETIGQYKTRKNG